MNRHKLAFSLIGIFIVQLSYAGYFKHIGREEGLSQSSVMAIYQDKLGRMWFGTREGVNIYNSNKMAVYKAWIQNGNRPDQKILIGNEVSAITGSQNGDVFLIVDHALLKYDIRKEKNYTLTGSPAQDIYYAYQQQTIPARHLLRTFRFQENKQPEDAKRMIAAQAELARQNREFIAGHSNLAVNLVLVEELKKEPFTYDQGYLDELEQLFASYRDTCPRLKNFRQYLKEASAFAQGKPLQEGKVITSKGDTLSLLAQLKAGQYTLIDFWASWCGPCRASFPHLREMYKLHGEKVNFISVSLDKEEKEWQKAMGEEKLPWSQFLATRALSKEVGKHYNLKSIPTFLFIAPDGKIIFSGHSSDELEAELAKTH